MFFHLKKTYTFLFPQFIYCLAQFIVPSIILILGKPIFFGAAMIGNIIYIFLNRSANKKIHHYLGVETKAAHVSQQSLYDAIVSTTELKAMGSKDWFINKTIEDFNQFRIPRMRSIFWRHFRYITVGLTLTISIVLFYFFGLDLLRNGELLLGEFIGYSFLMGLVSRGFSVFFYIIPAQYHALNYAKDLYEFMHLEPDVVELENILDAKIDNFDVEFKNVSFSYNEDQPIIDNVSFTIPAGKKTAIVGESGSGKSTIAQLLLRMYSQEKGEISINGVPVNNYGEQYADKISVVFQQPHFIPSSIKENLVFDKDYDQLEIESVCKELLCHDFIKEFPKEYETEVGERGTSLSGGQKQRLALSRALLKNTEILILDEATSALDTETEYLVQQNIDKLRKGKTTIIIAHRLSTIHNADVIYVLDKGNVVAQGTHDALMSDSPIYKELYTYQQVNYT